MIMDNNSLRSVCTIADYVDFLVTHSTELTPDERASIEDPVALTTTVMRRMLTRMFPAFSIRRNQDNFSLRCDSPNIFTYVRLRKVYTDFSYIRAFEESLIALIQRNVDLIPDLQQLRNSYDVSYRFRHDTRHDTENDKLFLYVYRTPYTHNSSINFNNTTRFESYSLKARMAKVIRIYELFRDLPPAPSILTKYISFCERFGRFFYDVNRNDDFRIDEAFIDYALGRPAYENLRTIITVYRNGLNPPAAEATLVTLQRPHNTTPRPTIELVGATSTGLTLNANVTPAGTASQDAFTAALARVRARNNEENNPF